MKAILWACSFSLLLGMISCGSDTTPQVSEEQKTEIINLEQENAVLENTATEIDAATKELEDFSKELDNL